MPYCFTFNHLSNLQSWFSVLAQINYLKNNSIKSKTNKRQNDLKSGVQRPQ